MGDVTLILQDLQQGDPTAANRLFSIVYDELRQVAGARMARESAGHTLQPTALVHEAWLRLGGNRQATWRNRAHFFGAAAEAMRRILIDHARKRHAARRGSGRERMPLDNLDLAIPAEDDGRLLALHEALARLEAADAAKAELVKLRYFTGLTIDEAAQALGISEATANRWWAFARAWLIHEMKASAGCS